MSALALFLITVVLAVAAKSLAWWLQLRTRNAGLVDPIWAFTLGTIAVVYAVAGPAPLATRVALGLMGGLWGLRLGLHLWNRNAGKPEDFRYAQFPLERGMARGRIAARFLGQALADQAAHAEAREGVRDIAALAEVDQRHGRGRPGNRALVVRMYSA